MAPNVGLYCCCGCPLDGTTCSNCSTSGTPSEFTVTVNTSPTLCSGCVDEACDGGSDDWDAVYDWTGSNPLTGKILLSQGFSPCTYFKQISNAFDYDRYDFDEFEDFADFVDGDCFDGVRVLNTYTKTLQLELTFANATTALFSVYAWDLSTNDHVLFTQKLTITSGVCTDTMTFDMNELSTCGDGANSQASSEFGYSVCSDGWIAATGGDFDIVCGDST